MRWHYKKQQPGDTTREPVQGEFFAVESIENAATALVREGIQNSLDAAPDGMTAEVRIHVSGHEGALPAGQIARYLENAWPHLLAERNGLREPPKPEEICPFLSFEDFGTTGVEGDVQQWYRVEGIVNSFFNFFRAEGQSDKGEQDRGRWGVGKFVFPRSSRVHTLYGLTVRRNDQQRLLLGRSVLRSHNCDEYPYWGNGYFGTPDPQHPDFILPIDDAETIDLFCHDFGLKRGTRPGLSVVVPWCDPDITAEQVCEAVVRGYFYPILAEKLSVTVSCPDGERTLNRQTLRTEIDNPEWLLSKAIAPFVRLTVWAQARITTDFISTKPPGNGAPKWSPDLMDDSIISIIRMALQRSEPVALRVSLTVTEREAIPRPSFFHVFLVRDSTDETGRPIFIREGIIIPDVRAPRVRGMRALVVIDDPALNTLLRSAEGVAHTQWSHNSDGFKQRYKFGKSYLDFVKESVSKIIQYVSEDQKPDHTALMNYFSLPAPKDETPVPEPAPESITEPGVEPPPPPPSITSSPESFHLTQVAGGFSVCGVDNIVGTPLFLEILAGYDRRKGDPIKKYDRADFEMDKPPIELDPPPEGVEVIARSDNRLFVRILQPDYRLTIKGFDEHRDLCVRVRVKGEGDGDTTI